LSSAAPRVPWAGGGGITGALLDAARGLFRDPATLPPWLFYDARGSELFEEITRLPEYYLTRAEREIFETYAEAILEAAGRPSLIAELGAGTAEKTEILLRTAGRCRYVPVDVSEAAMAVAVERIRASLPEVDVRPVVGTHLDVVPIVATGAWLLVFIGSSIGNFDDDEAVALLSAMPADRLLLGTDRKKDPDVLIRAYDDAAGVTAAFDLNLLVRLNRELGTDFALDRWHHEARWDDARSRIEMHLVTSGQEVTVPGLGSRIFAPGESIHTESCHKYDREHVERILRRSGFVREVTFTDAAGRFDVHLARRAPPR